MARPTRHADPDKIVLHDFVVKRNNADFAPEHPKHLLAAPGHAYNLFCTWRKFNRRSGNFQPALTEGAVTSCYLTDYFLHYASADHCGAFLAAVVREGHAQMVQAYQVHDRGVNVVRIHRVLHGPHA